MESPLPPRRMARALEPLVGEILSMPVALAYAASLGPAAMRGRVLGLYGLTWAAAMAVGPACGSAVFAVNEPALWLGCGALGLFGAAVMTWRRDRRIKSEALKG
jgi:dipeptide/tripeptide permease